MQKRLNANLISYIYFWHLCFPLLICSSLLTDKCIFISCPSSNSPVYISFFFISIFFAFSLTQFFLLHSSNPDFHLSYSLLFLHFSSHIFLLSPSLNFCFSLLSHSPHHLSSSCPPASPAPQVYLCPCLFTHLFFLLAHFQTYILSPNLINIYM